MPAKSALWQYKASPKLALHGGKPVSEKLLPYGRQWTDQDDVAAVARVLESDWLTTGPKVDEFENAFANFVGAGEAVAVSSGTAALHASMYAVGIQPGDEVIVPAITFAATANAVVYQGGIPVFADVHPDTLLIDPAEVSSKITSRTKAIIAVDYAGQPCDYDELQKVADPWRIALLADSCHSLGATYKGRPAGTFARLNNFSLHPVKPITTGEGGLVTTDDSRLARLMRRFRNHGITADHTQREKQGSWFYQMVDLGFNYRLSDLQCALGLSQLAKLPAWIERRQEIASQYDEAFANLPLVRPLAVRSEASHAYHLYVVRLDLPRLKVGRSTIFRALRAEGIGVNVHYIPVHLHPFYRRRFKTREGLCPRAEAAYESILSLPIFPRLSRTDVEAVVSAMNKVLEFYS